MLWLLPYLFRTARQGDLGSCLRSLRPRNVCPAKIEAPSPSPLFTQTGKVGAMTDFTSLGYKISIEYDCSHEIKRRLLLGREAMTSLDSVLKSRDITLSIKVHLVKAMFFPVVRYGCESWTIKKAEHPRNAAFELWCWRRLLRVPWTARRSPHQSILKEIDPGYSPGLMRKLKFQYFGHLM